MSSRYDIEIVWPPDVFLFSTYFFFSIRYDIEIVRLEDDSDRSPQDRVVSSLGGRRAAFRLLFAASFVPYLLPEKLKPGLYKDDWGARAHAQPCDEETSRLQ